MDLSNYKLPEKQGARSEREELLNKFFDRIDEERKGTKWKPINRRAYAIKLNIAFKNLWDLQRFYAECNDYGNFGQRFFGGFKKQEWTVDN
jgi:hypothetical protein